MKTKKAMRLLNLIEEYGSESRWVGHYYVTDEQLLHRLASTEAELILGEIKDILLSKPKKGGHKYE